MNIKMVTRTPSGRQVSLRVLCPEPERANVDVVDGEVVIGGNAKGWAALERYARSMRKAAESDY